MALHPRQPKDTLRHGCIDETRADDVRPDATGTVVERDVLGEQDDAALGRVVGAAAGRPLQAFDAGDGDERAALAVDAGLLDHPRERRLGHQEGAGEVDADDPVPLVPIEQVDRPTARDAGRVEDAVEAVGHGGEHGGDRGLVGDVGGDEVEVGPEIGRGRHVGPDDRAAGGQQPPRRGQPDPGRHAGHDERGSGRGRRSPWQSC
ncbi:hypothetical protein MSAS_00080 [Mycobacterium saskatchewanense]|nr:hypothetical protein MSAS_00080 [Mycobacterium saskatchewanense]